MEALYERDFYQWTQENARLLREGRLSEIDVENLIEELEGMGKSEKRQFVNRLAVLLAHLLKWQYQPKIRSKSWRYTIKEQRKRVTKILRDSPSLKHDLDDHVKEAYEDAILIILKETPLDESDIPASCPYTFEQVMDDDFWPE